MPQDDAGSVWRAYGLRANPFFQDELEPDPKAEHPISLFVGRETELQALRSAISGELHSRTVVEGAVGVGKTTLVNRIKVEKASRLLSQDDAVPVIASMPPNAFLAEVLRALLRMRTELHGRATLFRSTKDAVGKEKRGAAKFWKDAARIVNGIPVISPSLQGGTAKLSVGIGVTHGRIPADVPVGSLHPVVAEAVERLSAESRRDILLHVNNLENLSLRETGHAAELLLNIRSTLILPKTHWVFVGADGVDTQVFRVYDQISGFVPAAIVLAPLAPHDVAAMLRIRYQYLQRSRQYTAPIEPEEAASLYARFHGDLRSFLRIMSEASKMFLGTSGVRPLTAREVITFMAPVCAARLQRALGPTYFQHLNTFQTGLMPHEKFRVTDVERKLKFTQAAASHTLREWSKSKVILQSHIEGRNRYFTLGGEAAIAFSAADRS